MDGCTVSSERVERLAGILVGAAELAPKPEHGLPRVAQELMRRRIGLPVSRKVLRPLEELAARLDTIFPGWPEAATALVLTEPQEERSAAVRLAAGLLALRPLTFYQPLCQALREPEEPTQRELAALALFSTGAAEAQRARRATFELLAGRFLPVDSPDWRALWLIFIRLAQEKQLSYAELRRVVLTSQLLQPEGYPGPARPNSSRLRNSKGHLSLHPDLDRSGISSLPEFRRLYSMLVAEIAPNVAEQIPWPSLRWIRCFPGATYFWEALDRVEQEANNLNALFVLRWAQEVGEREPEFVERLAAYAPLTLMLTSLLRPELDEMIGAALDSPRHAPALRWLRRPCSEAAEDEAAIAEEIRPWLDAHSELFIAAMGVLCMIELPAEEPWPPLPEPVANLLRLQHFHALHLLPEFLNLMDNMLLLQGLRGEDVQQLENSAGAGRLAAMRALGLAEGSSDESARLLLELQREGGEPIRRAAQWALEKMARRHGLGDLDGLKQKLDMAAAWEDGGLVGGPARVWWDLGGYRVKLSLAGGKVEVSAWGPERKKRLPARVRAHPLYREVQETRRALATTYETFRARLEETMLSGWPFPTEHFRTLLGNPAFWSLAERLVISLPEGERLLEGLSREAAEAALQGAPWVRITHPIELWRQGKLEAWQEAVAGRLITQPFKQCFREIYPLEAAEAGQTESLRFAEQPVLARKAYALLKVRGYSPCRGAAYRDWPAAGVRARFVWTQEEQELWEHLGGARTDLPVATGAIYFERLEQRKRRAPAEKLALESIDPVVFSETLRDADLVVSAGAAGEEGFSSRQTLEIRAALVRNFARLLNLPGVKVEPGSSHARVQGERASYRIHLGSGRVLVEPTGRHLVLSTLVAPAGLVLSEEKGDSRTLAILEAVATLSNDREIGDPAFLAAIAAQ